MTDQPFWMRLGEAKSRLIRLVYKRDPVASDFSTSEEDRQLFDAAADYIEYLLMKLKEEETTLADNRPKLL